jgi:hypothetical protein
MIGLERLPTRPMVRPPERRGNSEPPRIRADPVRSASERARSRSRRQEPRSRTSDRLDRERLASSRPASPGCGRLHGGRQRVDGGLRNGRVGRTGVPGNVERSSPEQVRQDVHRRSPKASGSFGRPQGEPRFVRGRRHRATVVSADGGLPQNSPLASCDIDTIDIGGIGEAFGRLAAQAATWFALGDACVQGRNAGSGPNVVPQARKHRWDRYRSGERARGTC